MRTFTIVSVLVVLLLALGSTDVGAAPDRYVLPGDNVFPEGIAARPGGSDFYVGSLATGTIYRGTVAAPQAAIYLPGGADGRTQVAGLKVDRRGRLYAAGGPLGRMFVYDLAGKQLLAQFASGLTPTFVNDVAIAPNGDAYFTDSSSPAIYRVSADLATEERWSDLAGAPIVYGPGFNLNGIAASADGKYLVTVQTNTGKLFRVEIASKRVVAIDLGGAALTGGDGLLLEGQTLYVMRNAAARLVTLHLAADFASGTVVGTTTDPTFAFPTAVARVGDRLLVVNSQLDKRTTNQPPTLPFTVSSLPVPVAAPGLPNTGAGGARAPQRLGALAARGAGLVALLTSLGLLRVRRVAAEA